MLLPAHIIQAIGWTLIHSVWQGLIMAIFTGVIITCTKRSSPRSRYNLLLGLFGSFILVTCITFARELIIDHTTTTPAATVLTAVSYNTITFKQTANPSVFTKTEWLTDFAGYFNRHAAWIVTLWFILFLVKFLKISTGIAYIRSIRYNKSYAAEGWNGKINELCKLMGVDLNVSVRESITIKVPVVIGFFKPVILLPLGLLSNLPADQVEAILLHELAHIKRRDYLVNLLQCFAEAIFFFNPALLWISALIREEREHCCDDMAIRITNNKSRFVHALISFYETLNLPKYALAFPGRKDQLLNRVRRIVNEHNKSLNKPEKIFLACSFLIMGMMLSYFPYKANDREGEIAGTYFQFSQPVIIQQKPVVASEKKSSGIKKLAESRFIKFARPTLIKKDTLSFIPVVSVMPVYKRPAIHPEEGMITDGVFTTYYHNHFEVATKQNEIIAVYKDGKQIDEGEWSRHRKDITADIRKISMNATNYSSGFVFVSSNTSVVSSVDAVNKVGRTGDDGRKVEPKKFPKALFNDPSLDFRLKSASPFIWDGDAKKFEGDMDKQMDGIEAQNEKGLEQAAKEMERQKREEARDKRLFIQEPNWNKPGTEQIKINVPKPKEKTQGKQKKGVTI